MPASQGALRAHCVLHAARLHRAVRHRLSAVATPDPRDPSEASALCARQASTRLRLGTLLATTARQASTLLLQVRAALRPVKTAKPDRTTASPAALRAHCVLHSARPQWAAAISQAACATRGTVVQQAAALSALRTRTRPRQGAPRAHFARITPLLLLLARHRAADDDVFSCVAAYTGPN